MKNAPLHWLAILLALLALLLIINGAMVGPGSQPTPSEMLIHRVAAIPEEMR